MASPDVSQNGPGTRRIDSIHHYAEPTGPISLLRARTRKFLETLKVEFVTIGVVIVYMILIFLDLMLDKETRPGQLNAIEDGMPWTKAFMWIDLVFLVIFTLELFLRIFAFGYYYFWNALNVIDGLVVFTSFVLQVWIITLVDEVVDEGAGQAQSALALLRLLRLVRLFVVMNKVQKARDAYRKTKYLKLGSPVEKVIELLGEMKGKDGLTDEDQKDIQWIMDLIASDKLYTINTNNLLSDVKDKEMSDFLQQEVGIKGGLDLDGNTSVADSDDLTSLSQAHGGLLRQETKWAPGDPAAEAILEVQRISEVDAMQPHLDRIHDWDVDVFAFWEASENQGLVVATYHLLEHHNLISKFKISKPRLVSFLTKMQEGYRNANPYHNVVHALDVLLNMNYFLNQENLQRLMSPLDHLACLLAAAVHDFRHPGYNNNFLAATRHEHAITYSDQSVLESMHVASAWAILLTEECNFLSRLSKDQFNEFRSVMIQLVLATDMKYHFEHTSKFKTKLQSDGYQPGCEREDTRFVLGLALHTADIANPAKPRQLCLLWTEMVMEEFFCQGDEEARVGLPISPFYDRAKTSIAQCQMGFINVLVKPLYTEFCNLLGEPALSDCVTALQANLDGWEKDGNAMLKEISDCSFLDKGIVGAKAKS